VTAPDAPPELPDWWDDLGARTAAQLAAPDPYQPDPDRTPSPFSLRQAEMRDLRAQGPGPLALWSATTITAEEYL
jgi:hypothetical protein